MQYCSLAVHWWQQPVPSMSWPRWAKGNDSQRVNLFHLLLTTEQALLAGLLPGECGPWPLWGWDAAVKALPNKSCNLAHSPSSPVAESSVKTGCGPTICELKGKGKDGVKPPKYLSQLTVRTTMACIYCVGLFLMKILEQLNLKQQI